MECGYTASVLIVLPSHLRVSGVTTWAARTVELLRSRGERAGLLVHTHAAPVPEFLEELIVGRVTTPTPIQEMGAKIQSLTPIYARAIEAVRPADGSPTVVAPCVPGDCYGVVGEVVQSNPNVARVISWVHSDNAYDLHVAGHYAPLIHAFVPVSRELAHQVGARLPDRKEDIHQIDHAVDIPDHQPCRAPVFSRAIRLVYTGRLVKEQKRVDAFPAMVEYLVSQGVSFELKIAGDGPDAAELRQTLSHFPQVGFTGAVSPADIPALLAWGDVWVNPSRYEGQCIAMLEAMSLGCVPVMARIASGQDGVVMQEHTGILANAGPEHTPRQAGIELAKAIVPLAQSGLGRMPEQAAGYVQAHHHPSVYIDRVLDVIRRTRLRPARQWPAGRPVAFSAPDGGTSGSTPAHAASLLRAKLEELDGRRVLIYGMGKHTKDLSNVLEHCGAGIVGVLDDHPADNHERFMQWPVVRPEAAHQLEATDVVISSFIHEQGIWLKRDILEQQGLVVHRLYHGQQIKHSSADGDQLGEPAGV